jgi:galactokinase
MSDESPLEERAIAAGKEAFGFKWTPSRIATAPGRLELLGNHVDYNGGNILAAAIDRSIAVAVGESDSSDSIGVVFADIDSKATKTIVTKQLTNWRNEQGAPEPSDYLRGAVASLAARGLADLDRGKQIAIAGDIPIGLGLSSSAALCVASVMALSNRELPKRDIVLLAQEAEHRAGTPCGTMDQSASVAGGFILLDASDVSFEKLSPELGENVFAVADSGVSRSLGQSSYPIRVAESKAALEIANRELGQHYLSLAMVTPNDLEVLSDPSESELPVVLLRRIRHVVTECERVKVGYQALQEADWNAFGALMTASGRSSALDYEISHPRVEELVSEALEVEGVLGARMMGGGEGGTALILVKRSAIPHLKHRLAVGYYATHALPLGVHVLQSAPGAHVRELN